MKKILALVFSFFCLIGSFTLADLAGYTITNYDVEMNLHQDGSMDVNETIDVNFSESRHGIYKKIPFYNPSGRYTVIENLKANGDPATSYTENNTYQLRIGDANRSIIGPHTYHISYTVKNAIAGFEENDSNWTELYWNVIGTERETNIDKVHFTLHLPKETAFSSDEYYTVYGKQGEKKTEGSQISAINTTTLEGNITKRLSANQGATIGVKFPTDYFDLSEEYLAIKAPISISFGGLKISGISEAEGLMIELTIIIVMVGGFIICLRWGSNNFFKWLGIIFFGGGIIGILKTIPPALILGGIIFCIVYSKITRNNGSKIERFPENDAGTKTYNSKKAITIYYTPPKEIDLPLASQIYNVKESRILSALVYFRANAGFLAIKTKEEKILRFKQYSSIVSKTKKILTDEKYFPALFENFFKEKPEIILSEIEYERFHQWRNTLQDLVKTKRKPYYMVKHKRFILPYRQETLNEKGEEIYEQIRGFAYFLEHVEEPRLQQMLKDDPDYIDEVLPRAVLFGVETKFLKAIEQIIQKPYQPEWYTGDTLFSATVLHSLSSQIQSATTPPPSSSGSGGGGSSGFSSGGGSSGGGGGGGGGGSW